MRAALTRPVLITGGAGFIGTNLADRLCRVGQSVVIYDNLSRPGVERNLQWLERTHGPKVRTELADVGNYERLRRVVKHAGAIFHFAAQVAVTTSLDDPFHDFEVNARGTLNLLEAVRSTAVPPPLVFTSTNKVYGALDSLALATGARRYQPIDEELGCLGVSEARPLDFHSPYGCSKGAADQYVLDYAHTFGLPAVVFRMSCIYGPHQFGTEDQGWLAHFVIRAITGEPITLYGDGKQVRDVLFVDDLVNAFLLARERIEDLAGQPYNIGGGPQNTISLLELIDLIGELHGTTPEVRYEPWRPADQRYYVSDTRRFQRATGWTPRVDVIEGLERLHAWLLDDRIGLPSSASNGAMAPVARAGRQHATAEWRRP
ncbi:MAG TPA: NAD-dependent epimerase/dehydratase family protein [Gemmatimonadales bacterium]|nr:NAD-dependent epimerase/dehydratase family protein [Gemmatimonadales bacterium]